MAQLWTQLTTQLEDRIKFEDERHQQATRRAWQLNAALVRCEMAHELSRGSGNGADAITKEERALDDLVRQTVLSPHMYNNIVHNGGDIASFADGDKIGVHPRAPRLGGLGSKMEDYARYKAFRHFLSEEKLLPPNAPCFLTTDEKNNRRSIVTDEEYLAGVIGLCHDLGKHGVTRASDAADDDSVVPFIKRMRDAVSLILEELLQFDFRNGPLRRKYDSTKYALKTLETVLYELSVAGSVGGRESLVIKEKIDDGGPLKRMRLDEEGRKSAAEDIIMQEGGGMSLAIPKKEIGEIRERTDHRDKLRESLIKTCRDGQKSAKQAIFALHRGDAKRATKLLSDCEKCVTKDLLPILNEEPTLRHGSFAGVLEEYVEGKLFYTWLYGGDGDQETTDNRAVGRILLLHEIPLNLSSEDYLGGLCDLTGEIGRFAVARGTVRDKESVKLCLDSSKSIYMTLKMLGKLPRNVTKKVGMVSKGVEKLERVLYEQSLMEMTGRKEFATGVEAANDAAFDSTFGME